MNTAERVDFCKELTDKMRGVRGKLKTGTEAQECRVGPGRTGLQG